MTKKENRIKKFSLLLVIGTLFIPLGQEFFYFFEIKPLAGAFVTAPRPVFSFDNWFEGTFQAEKEKYGNQNFGTRDFMVRLNNQLDYWLFKEMHVDAIEHGKKGMLYSNYYIKAYLGDDYLGEESIRQAATQLSEIQKKMAEKNKTLLVILAPGKGSFFPEYFPESYNRPKKRNNHEEYAKQLVEKGVNTFDANTWFLQKKGKTPYPLFTELGIHWSEYGSSLAFDSIVKNIEQKRNIQLPDYIVERYDTPDTLSVADKDIYTASNLLFDMPHTKAAYPVMHTKNEEGKAKPRVLAVGDSYWWNIRNAGLDRTVFKDGRFWFYNSDAFPETTNLSSPVKVSSLDFGKTIEESDVIILCYTELNFGRLGDGFIKRLHNYYYPRVAEKQALIKSMMDYIRSNKGWMEQIKARSEKEKQPVDSIIYHDAKWQVELKEHK